MTKKKVIITCEHGGNRIPKEYTELFLPHKQLLSSHRGYDIGAWELADIIYNEIGDYYFHSVVTRLLIDFNRTPNSRSLYSPVTKDLDTRTKEIIKRKYYDPYIQAITQTIDEFTYDNHLLIHLSIHSFTPAIDGVVRNADVGILYDPKREKEKSFALNWKEQLYNESNFKVRMNYPYKGIANGLTTYFRLTTKSQNYIGIELEVNQNLLTQNRRDKFMAIQQITESLKNALKLIGNG